MNFYSTEGFSVEFATLNPQGFFFYSLYTVAGYLDPTIGAGSVATNDLFFALHAFMISSVQLTQVFVYGDSKNKEGRKLVLWPVVLIVAEWLFVLTIFFIEISGVQLNENI